MAEVRATDPRAGGIRAVLIAEDAFEDVDFLTADVGVGIEPGLRRPTYEGDMLGEAFMERGDLESRHHALPPLQALTGHGIRAFFGLGPIAAILVQDTARLGAQLRRLTRQEPNIRKRPEGRLADQKGSLGHQDFAELLTRVRPGFPSHMRHDRNPRPVTLPLAFQRHRSLPLQDGDGVHHDALGMVGM